MVACAKEQNYDIVLHVCVNMQKAYFRFLTFPICFTAVGIRPNKDANSNKIQMAYIACVTKRNKHRWQIIIQLNRCLFFKRRSILSA